MIKRRAVHIEVHPIGTAHLHLLLDTHLHEAEFKDGITEKYFFYVVAENLYSYIYSKRRECFMLKER